MAKNFDIRSELRLYTCVSKFFTNGMKSIHNSKILWSWMYAFTTIDFFFFLYVFIIQLNYEL